ncbi:MAG: efflux RND transporter periplasmic adaptor subunit [Synergistaceae bacterium]|jgi:hypothetical protein|nr:efflux RND transporter periplasmic adaptor subunit [Synergistaceae bacterium]
MQKPASGGRTERSVAYRLFYGLCILLISCVWIYAFKSYFDHYDSVHPEIAWAVPWVQTDVVPAEGVLLWNEKVVLSPRDGTVKYPAGRGPVRVPKGEIVAKVTSGSAESNIKSEEDGYFVAGLDGFEEQWKYSTLWLEEPPEPPPLKMLEDGAKVSKGAPIGKLIPQPQELRLIGYVDLTEDMIARLETNRLMIKMDALDTSSRSYVQVYEMMGHRAKVYVDIPWFPPQTLMSRKYKMLVETGETSGVAIPESAVGSMKGKQGAFVLKGSNAAFTEIKGRIIDGSRFLATEGLKLGDAVIVDADGAREGRVRLW